MLTKYRFIWLDAEFSSLIWWNQRNTNRIRFNSIKARRSTFLQERTIRHALCERHQDFRFWCSVNWSSQSAFQIKIWDDWSRRSMIFEHEDQSSQWLNYTDLSQIRQKSTNQTRHERMFFRAHINDWNQADKIISQLRMW